MSALVIDHVVFVAGGRIIGVFDAHRARDLRPQLTGEIVLLVLVFGEIERETNQGVAELVFVRRVEIHKVLAIRQVIAGEADRSNLVAPFERGGFPLRSPGRFRFVPRKRVETRDRTAARSLAAEHAKSQNPLVSR